MTDPGIEAGSVAGGTSALEANESCMMMRNMMPCTAPDVRTFIPAKTDTQDSESANRTASRHPATADAKSESIRKPIT